MVQRGTSYIHAPKNANDIFVEFQAKKSQLEAGFLIEIYYSIFSFGCGSGVTAPFFFSAPFTTGNEAVATSEVFFIHVGQLSA